MWVVVGCFTGGEHWEVGNGALDSRITVGYSALACQTRIVPTVSTGSRTPLLIETPFRFLFRCRGRVGVLASRFDMEGTGKRRAQPITSTIHLKGPCGSILGPALAVRLGPKCVDGKRHVIQWDCVWKVQEQAEPYKAAPEIQAKVLHEVWNEHWANTSSGLKRFVSH